MNGQVINFARLAEIYRKFCPVERGLSIVTRAEHFGNTEPEDPLCVYKDDKGIQYLTGADITAYLRVICKLVTPNISDAELKLISSHSIRVCMHVYY